MSETETVSVRHLADLSQRGSVDLIDVRTPAEFRELHATPARNVPLDSLEPEAVIKTRTGSAEDPLYVICLSGSRAAKARKKFLDAGYPNVVNVEGGTAAWDASGLPVVRGKKSISLERQVRILAGFLVLIGALLSLWNVYFALLSGFVGGGLMFAGITDTCAMGTILGSMPWNQVRDIGTCCATSESE